MTDALPLRTLPLALSLLLSWPLAAHANDTTRSDDPTRALGDTEAAEGPRPDAREDELSPGAEPQPADRDPVLEHIRFEGTIGFLGGYARYADLGLTGPLPVTAFDEGVASGAPVAGLRYDLRLVVAFVRMTAGADLSFSLFDATATTRPLAREGGAQTLTDRSAFLWALRFGLGLELAASEDVRLFADVLGSIRFLEVQSTVDTTNVTSTNVSFAPGLRIGARVRVVDAFFVQVAADGTPFGPTIGGELSVGGAFE